MASEDGEHLQKLHGRPQMERRRCRLCFIPMHTAVENRLGIHIRCVYHASQRQTVTLRGPVYGRRKSEDTR